MIAVPVTSLPRGDQCGKDLNEEVFLGFARVWSGVVTPGMLVHVLPTNHDPVDADSNVEGDDESPVQEGNQDQGQDHDLATTTTTTTTTRTRTPTTAVVTGVYLMMGTSLEPLPRAPVGAIVALAGLDQAVLRSATLSTTSHARPFRPMIQQTSAIVRVSVEPKVPQHFEHVRKGLELLKRADPFVETEMTGAGELILAAAGEVHLETCLKDLTERFARVPLVVSPPLVGFRETVRRWGEEKDMDGSYGVLPESTGAGAGADASGSGTTSHQSNNNNNNNNNRLFVAATPDGRVLLRVRVRSLPGSVANALEASHADLSRVMRRGKGVGVGVGRGMEGNVLSGPSGAQGSEMGGGGAHGKPAPFDVDAVRVRERLVRGIARDVDSAQEQAEVHDLLGRCWMTGPGTSGTNLLVADGDLDAWMATSGATIVDIESLRRRRGGGAAAAGGGGDGEDDSGGGGRDEREKDMVTRMARMSMSRRKVPVGRPLTAHRLGLSTLLLSSAAAAAGPAPDVYPDDLDMERSMVEGSVATAFGYATSSGPLCGEPCWGLAFEVDAMVDVSSGESGGCGLPESDWESRDRESRFGPLSGQIMNTATELFRAAVMGSQPRLAQAMYLCELTCAAAGIGGAYATLNKRSARIVSEDTREGTDHFIIQSHLPVASSFGFAAELRTRSGGAGTAQLQPSHWERLPVDPFFVPLTVEEREEFGEEGHGQGGVNVASAFINQVRRRKGLPVEEKIVESATRQRTLARKK